MRTKLVLAVVTGLVLLLTVGVASAHGDPKREEGENTKESAASSRNKAELIDAIASGANLSKADAKRALDAFVASTTKALKKGDRVALVGFGSFSVTKRAARTGRNPQTGTSINIPAKKVVKLNAFVDHCGNLRKCTDDKELASLIERAAKLEKRGQGLGIIDIAKRYVKEQLREEGSVNLRGFGSFIVKKRAAETKVNLITGEKIRIPARNVVKFKAGADLSKKVS